MGRVCEALFSEKKGFSSEKLEKAGTVDFKKHPARKVGTRSPAVWAQGSPFPVLEIPEFVAFRDSGKFFQQFSRDFPGVFLENPRTDPGNSHSLLEFSDFSEQGGGNSVNQGFGKDFYRKGNSVKSFGPFTEPPDSEN